MFPSVFLSLSPFFSFVQEDLRLDDTVEGLFSFTALRGTLLRGEVLRPSAPPLALQWQCNSVWVGHGHHLIDCPHMRSHAVCHKKGACILTMLLRLVLTMSFFWCFAFIYLSLRFQVNLFIEINPYFCQLCDMCPIYVVAHERTVCMNRPH